jgi:hypothetical protein
MRCVLPIVARIASLGPTGPKFWIISSAPAGMEAERATNAPAAANFRKLRESGNIGISFGVELNHLEFEEFYLPAPIYDMANATLKRQSQELSQVPTNSPPTEIALVGLVRQKDASWATNSSATIRAGAANSVVGMSTCAASLFSGKALHWLKI